MGSKIIDDKLYEDLYPDVTQIPRAYGLPKIHKEGYPLREIVDSTNSAGKKIDKYVSRIIKTYTLDNPHNIKNSRDFVDKIKPLIVDENKQMISFDVAALYPSVPQDQALNILEEYLQNDQDLKTKTPIPADELMDLFKIVLREHILSSTHNCMCKSMVLQLEPLLLYSWQRYS